jgi:hypothetical protein
VCCQTRVGNSSLFFLNCFRGGGREKERKKKIFLHEEACLGEHMYDIHTAKGHLCVAYAGPLNICMYVGLLRREDYTDKRLSNDPRNAGFESRRNISFPF